MRADLHIHTVASDGCWTPEQVVAGCQAKGIELFAVADHDAIDSVLETEALAHEAGLVFLRGVEISAIADSGIADGDTVEGDLYHILGYGIDPTYPPLVALLEENTIKLMSTDDNDIHQLIKLGYPLDYEDYLAYEYDRTRGGFKSLNYLLDQELCTSTRDFFQNIRARLNHQWPDFPSPSAVIDSIHEAGGFPILAHPGASLEKNGGVTEDTLSPFLDYGIVGLECYSQYHDAATTAFCVAWCERYNLLITGGSDYHGGYVGRQLGVPVVDTAQLR